MSVSVQISDVHVNVLSIIVLFTLNFSVTEMQPYFNIIKDYTFFQRTPNDSTYSTRNSLEKINV